MQWPKGRFSVYPGNYSTQTSSRRDREEEVNKSLKKEHKRKRWGWDPASPVPPLVPHPTIHIICFIKSESKNIIHTVQVPQNSVDLSCNNVVTFSILQKSGHFLDTSGLRESLQIYIFLQTLIGLGVPAKVTQDNKRYRAHNQFSKMYNMYYIAKNDDFLNLALWTGAQLYCNRKGPSQNCVHKHGSIYLYVENILVCRCIHCSLRSLELSGTAQPLKNNTTP